MPTFYNLIYAISTKILSPRLFYLQEHINAFFDFQISFISYFTGNQHQKKPFYCKEKSYGLRNSLIVKSGPFTNRISEKNLIKSNMFDYVSNFFQIKMRKRSPNAYLRPLGHVQLLASAQMGLRIVETRNSHIFQPIFLQTLQKCKPNFTSTTH